MPDKKYLIEIPGMPEGSGVWDADKWERNKDLFMEDYPEANVFELGEYDADDAQETDQIMLDLGNEDMSGVWDNAKWERNKDLLMEDYPEARVSRVRYVDYWGQKAEENRAKKAELLQPNEERNTKLAELGYYDDITGGQVDFDLNAPSVIGLRPLSSAISTNSVSGETEYLDPRVQEFFANDSAETDRQAEIARLDAEYDANPSVIAQREWQAKVLAERKAYASNLEKQIKSDMESDVDMVKAARGGTAKRQYGSDLASDQMSYLLDKIAGDEAGSGSAENEKLENYNTALKFLEKAKIARDVAGKGFGGAVGDWTKEGLMDLATQDDIEAYNEIGSILTRLEKQLGNIKSENLTEEVFDKYLTKNEQALIKAFYEYNSAMAEAQQDMSRAYKGGKIFAESVPFMLEFLATGGIYKGAGRAATSWMGKAFAKWIAKSAAKTTARAAKVATSKIVSGVVKAGVGTLARTAVAPGTYDRMAEASINMDDEGHLHRAKESAVAFADMYVENLSEISGGLIGKGLGLLGKGVSVVGKNAGKFIAKTPLSKVGTMLADNAFMQGLSKFGNGVNAFMPKLKALGFHGLPEEVGEEFIGNTIRDIAGIQPGALKEMVSDDNFGAMLIGFAPMTMLGVAGGIYNLGVVNAKAAQLGKDFREKFGSAYTEEELDHMMSVIQNAQTAEDIQKALKPIAMAAVNSFEKGMISKEQMTEQIEMLYQYGGFMAQNNALLFGKKAQDRQMMDAKREEFTNQYGRFWQEDQNETVQIATLNNGSTVFVVSTPAEDGKITTIDVTTGKKGFANVSDIATQEVEGEQIQSTNSMTMDAFLNGQIATQRKTAEETRMNNERNAQIEALRAQITPGTRINLGTEGSPVIVYAKGTNKNGVVIVDETGMESLLGWEQAAYALGQPINVETDQQKLDAEISDRLQRMAERRMQRAITPATQATVEAAEGAAEVVAQEQQNIPLNEDGTVNEALFWTQDPEGYVKWNDEQNQDGGQDSLRQIAISKQELFGMLNEAATGQNTSNPTMRKAAEKQVAAIAEKIARLEALEMSYADALAEEQEAVQQTAATPTATMSEEQLEQMDTQYQGILGKTRIQSERVRVMQEYLDKISEESFPVIVLTRANYAEKMKAEGCEESRIKIVERYVKLGKSIGGFTSNGKLFLMEEGLSNINEARVTYVHERQHVLNTQNPKFVQAIVEAAGGNRDMLVAWLKSFVGNEMDAYKSLTPEGLADELICRCMEIAYTSEEFSVDLQSKGIPSEVTSIITEIDNEQRSSTSLANARRRGRRNENANVNIEGGVEENGRDSRQVSGGILGNEAVGSSGSSNGGAQIGEGRDSAEVEEESEEKPEGPSFRVTKPEDSNDVAEQGTIMDIANQDDSGIRFSIRTENYLEKQIRAYANSAEGKKAGWTEEKIESIIKETRDLINAIHNSNTGNEFYDDFAVKDPTIRLDWRDGVDKPIVTWTRANMEYKYDMSADLLCINNEGLEAVLSSDKMIALMEMFIPEKKPKKGEPAIKFTSDDYLELYNTLKDLGFVVPCKGCFDAAGRFKMLPSVAQKFAAEVNAVIAERNKDPKKFDEKLKAQSGEKTTGGLPATTFTKSAAIAVGVAGDNLTEPIKWTQLMSADGQTKMLSDWGGIFRAWQRTGAGRPKDKLLPEPYYGDIVSSHTTIIGAYGESTPSFRDILVNTGTGLRRNSHSEFRPVLAVDEIQFMRDAFIRNLTVFKYMKELDDVRLFGKMGVKYNMSFFPEYVPGTKAAGLDLEGNYIASEESVGSREFPYLDERGVKHYDGMKGFEEAQKHINKDVSLSSVILSIPHLLKALTDVPTPSDARGVWGSLIPFHSSGATTSGLAAQGLGLARANGAGHGFEEAMYDYGKGVTNFEAVQNDRFGKGWEIISGKKAGTKVEEEHKLEFANGTHYYNRDLGVHLFSSGYILDSELPEGVLMENGDLNIDADQKKDLMHKFKVDYNDKVRELATPYAYKEAADFYLSELPKIGLIPRFDFTVEESVFLQMCADANVDPRHPKLGWKGEGNGWSPIDSEAYYSLFCDFGMTDPATGEWSPHNPVGVINESGEREFRLPENAVEIVREGLERFSEVRRAEAGKIDDAIKTFAQRSVEKGRISKKDAEKVVGELRMRVSNEGPIDLVEEARKADLRHRVAAEGTLVPGHKKGQPMLSDTEMMAEVSFRITKNTKATIEKWFNKAGIDDELTQSTINYLDSAFKDATEQLCAAKWYLGGKINLPGEDDYKVRDAVKVAKKNKVDALLYDSPMDIIYQFGKPNEKQKPINPDNVPTLKNRTEVPGTDIVIYDVEESEESRENLREIINTHYGKNASPWCLLQGNEDGKLTSASAEYWQRYSAYPKKVAFKGGRLLAFSANSVKNVAWWDRLDKPFEGVPVMEKLNDAQNRRATSVINPKTGKQIRIADVHQRIEKDGYTIIKNWDGIDGPMLNAQKRKNEALIAQFNRYTKEDFATDLQYWFAGRPNGLDQVYTQEKTISFSPNGELENYYVEGYRLSYNRYGSATWLITTRTPVIQEYGFNRKGKLVSFFSGTELITNRKRLAEVEVPDEYKALVGRNPKSFMAEAEQLIIEAGLAEAYEESSVSFRITPEQDKAYMDAVEAGDMETAQRMVIEAARLAMPNTKVVDKYGNPKIVMHLSSDEFTKFGEGINTNVVHSLGFFTDELEGLKDYHDKFFPEGFAYKCFLNFENPEVVDFKGQPYWSYKDESTGEVLTTDLIAARTKREGKHDGLIMLNVGDELAGNIGDEINDFVPFIPSQIKSAEPVTYDDNGNVIPLSQRFNPKNADIRFSIRSEEQREKLFADAKAHYGVTKNFNAAGYMLPDGSLLDFSEANDGGDPNSRSLDHRDIEGIIMDNGVEYDSRWMYIADFMNEGAIRLMPESAGINMIQAPTEEQRKKIFDFIYKHNGEVILEINDERLNSVAYMEYNRRTSPSRIFRDIDGYFNDGIVPQQDIRFRMRGENESAEEFIQTEINRFQETYGTKTPMLIVDYSSKEAAARSLGMNPEDLLDENYQLIVEAAEDSDACFISDIDTIAIFAKESVTTSGKADNIFFHENTHAFVKENPQLLELGQWLFENSQTGIKKSTAEIVRAKYPKSQHVEEMLTGYTGLMLSLGRSRAVLKSLPEELKSTWEEIVTRFNYNSEYEDTRRKSDTKRDADGGRNAASVQMRNSSDAELENKGGISWKRQQRDTDVRFRSVEITPKVQDELDAIKASAIVMGNFMKAPNGQPTSLTEEQWLMVRTENFKSWFGDWENDPENASKVIDDNGEPRIMYHGSDWQPLSESAGNAVFNMNEGMLGKGAYFASSLIEATMYAEIATGLDTSLEGNLETLQDEYVSDYFLNIRDKKDIFEFGNNDIIAVAKSPSQIKSATDNTGEFSEGEGDIRFKVVTDPSKIEELESGPKIKVYRAMQLIDGKLYPPMSAKVDGQLRQPIELGQWEEAEERPDLADDKGYFKLDKGNKKSLKARYNPYFHTSPTPLNDQFSSAQSRPELVTVEVEIPASELTSGYKADKAKDSVGEQEWKAGVIQGKLSGTRKVILSRWDKPVRIVPDSEVADEIVKMFEGKDIVMPSNVVTPSLRAELEKRGVPFAETDNNGKPISEFGPIYEQFRGKPKEAVEFLMEKKTGEAVGALNHKDIGDISIVYGNEKAGLKKIAVKHPEVLDILQDILDDATIVQQSENRIKLESDRYFAVISKDYLGKPRTPWLLTSFEKKNSVPDNTMDTGETSKGSKQNDTATLQDTVSESKDSDNIDTSNELDENTSFRVTGTPTEDVVAEGVSLSPAQLASLAGDIFAALPEESRKKITDGLNGNILGLQDAIMQIPTTLATKEDWNDEDAKLANAVRTVMQDAIDKKSATSRPLTTKEALWVLYDSTHTLKDLVDAASRAFVAHNFGFDQASMQRKQEVDDYIRFRTASNGAIDAATDMYNYETSLWTERLKESWLDMNQSVISLQKAMAEASGMPIEPWENIEFALNRLSSKSYADKKKYLRDFLMPMWDTILDIVKHDHVSIEEIERYMMLKHGLERNKKFASRDAKEYYRTMYDLVAERMKNQSHAQQTIALSEAKKRLADIDAQIAVASSSQLPRLNEARARAQYDVDVADLVLRGDEQQNETELQAYYDAIDNEADPKYREFREKDYGGLTSMFVDTTEVKRSDYKSEEAYQQAVLAATTPRYDDVAAMESAAEREVSLFENKVYMYRALWDMVNAATKETLRHQYESGMITIEQYEAVRDMFEFYVPLRGFADNTAEDMYSYYMSNSAGGFAKPILSAKGRKTRAESPLGWIGTMAESAIQADNKNEAKMCLYYMTLRRPDQNLLTITETWYEYTGQKDANGKKIFKAVYPPAVDHVLNADDLRQHMEDWEDDMKKKQSRGEAYKGSQRVDLKGSVIFQDEKEEKEHVVRVKVAGKDYSILINGNPRAAQAINGLLNPDSNVGPVEQWIGDARRNLSALLTSYSPLFWVANYQRDLLSSIMRVSEADGWDTAMKYLANRRKAWRVASYIYKYDAGTLGDSYYENLYKEFAENGGITGYTSLTTNKEYDNLLEKYANNVDKHVLNAVKGVWDKFMGFGEAIEQVSRFAAFITAREEGKSIEEAINAAKEVSVNFNRKGSAKPISLKELDKLRTKDGKKLNDIQRIAALTLSAMPGPMKFCYYFVNASIQALSSSAKLAKKSPGKASAWVGMYMGTSIALAMLNYLLSDDDDDEYLNLPDYLRHSTALVKIADGYYFKWSIPQEMRPFYAWADILVRKMMGKMPHKSGAEVGKEMALAASQWLPVNPFDAEDPLLSVIPDFLSPLAEIRANTNAFGGKIYNDMAFKSEGVVKEIPAYRKATEKTGAVYVDIAEFINDVSGGDEVTKGVININPAIVEHLIEGYGGGIYDFAKMMVSIPSMIISDDPVQIKEIPFVNKLILSVDETNMYSHTNEAFRHYKDIADNAKRVEKEYRESDDPSRADAYREEEDWRIYLLYKQYEKDFKDVKERLDNAVDKEEEDLLKQEQNVLREMFLDDIAKGDIPEITFQIREDVKRFDKEVKTIMKPVTEANKERLERKRAGDVDGMIEAIEKRDSLKDTPEYRRAEELNEDLKKIKQQLKELGSVTRGVQRDSVIGELQKNYESLVQKMEQL